MKLVVFLIFLGNISFVQVFCQTDERIISSDTLVLQEIQFKKTLGYKMESATIFIDYNNYSKSYTKFWKNYKRRFKSYERERKKGEVVNPDFIPRWNFLDSLHSSLQNEVKTKDTVYIDEKIFKKYDLGPGHDFTIEIENGNCGILDKMGIRHYTIIKQKRAYQRDFLNGWGGRRYYFIGCLVSFINGTDWRS